LKQQVFVEIKWYPKGIFGSKNKKTPQEEGL